MWSIFKFSLTSQTNIRIVTGGKSYEKDYNNFACPTITSILHKQ